MTGQYEIQNPFLAVFADQYFDLTIDQVRNCLTGLVSDNHPSRHYCTVVTGVLTHKDTLRSASCSAAMYYDSQLVTDACVQSATLARRPTFSHVQENQWVYGSPGTNHLLRVFCPPEGEETHSSMALDSNGDLLQIPEIYSARYGEVALPATFGLLNWFQEAVPVHRPLLFCMYCGHTGNTRLRRQRIPHLVNSSPTLNYAARDLPVDRATSGNV